MTDSIMEDAKTALDDGKPDPGRLKGFTKGFCECEFWVQARTRDHVDGRDLVGFPFTRLEGVELPVLMLFLSREEGQQFLGVEERALQLHPGAVFLPMAAKAKFHAVLKSGREVQTILHAQLVSMLGMVEPDAIAGVDPGQDPGWWSRFKDRLRARR